MSANTSPADPTTTPALEQRLDRIEAAINSVIDTIILDVKVAPRHVAALDAARQHMVCGIQFADVNRAIESTVSEAVACCAPVADAARTGDLVSHDDPRLQDPAFARMSYGLYEILGSKEPEFVPPADAIKTDSGAYIKASDEARHNEIKARRAARAAQE